MKEELELIDRKARELKSMVGLGLSMADCEAFVDSVIQDIEEIKHEQGVHNE